MVSGRSRFCDSTRASASARLEFVEEYPFVSNVLVDQEQAFVVGRDNKTLVKLSDRMDLAAGCGGNVSDFNKSLGRIYRRKIRQRGCSTSSSGDNVKSPDPLWS